MLLPPGVANSLSDRRHLAEFPNVVQGISEIRDAPAFEDAKPPAHRRVDLSLAARCLDALAGGFGCLRHFLAKGHRLRRFANRGGHILIGEAVGPE